MGNDSISLRSRLTTRLALALFLIGILGNIVAYRLAFQYASLVYDRSQSDDVITLANQISTNDGEVHVNLPDAALTWLLANEGDQVYYRVSDLRTGKPVVGNWDFGFLKAAATYSDQIQFSDIDSDQLHLRVARLLRNIEPNKVPVLIELAETTGKRDRVRSAILGTTIIFMITIIAVAVGLVWREVRNAFEPLQVIEKEVSLRTSSDLSPLDANSAPAEVHGLIVSFNDMMSRVSTAIKAQDNFIANAAHQLRTPLAGLRLQAQLALKIDDPESIHSKLLDIEASATRTAHLIEQLLALAKAETPYMANDLTTVNLEQIAYQVIERYLPLADKYEADLGFEGNNLPCRIKANPILIEELLGNLVDNAIRYGGKNITISTDADAHRVALTVSDDGKGFEALEISRAFERFYRSDSTNQTGAGLGLAIVREVADRYQAVIDLQSEPGKGSRFEVIFKK